MKKAICLILAICMIIGIKSHCFAFDTTDQSFSATVITCRYIEATDKYSFCAVGDVYGNGRRDPFTFGISREYVMTSHLFFETLVGNLEMGQIITVYFNGEVMESYPMQIVADMVFVEDEIEELTEDEKLGYLSMFYTEEWLIENGYMEVPPAEGEAVEPDIEYDEDTTLPDDDEDLPNDGLPDDEYSYVYGTPQAGDDAGKCVMLTKHYLDGFVVMADVISNDVEGAKSYVNLYFLAYSNFDAEEIAPVRIDFEEDSLGMLGLKFNELADGMNLRIYCDYGAYCVPVEGEKYYQVDGDVVTIEKLDGETENYDEYMSYFFEIGNATEEYSPDLFYIEADDTDENDDISDAVINIPTADEITEDSDNSDAMTVLWIIVCGGITVASIVMLILLLKKK